jgi:hypothetical protein
MSTLLTHSLLWERNSTKKSKETRNKEQRNAKKKRPDEEGRSTTSTSII